MCFFQIFFFLFPSTAIYIYQKYTAYIQLFLLALLWTLLANQNPLYPLSSQGRASHPVTGESVVLSPLQSSLSASVSLSKTLHPSCLQRNTGE